MKKQTYLFFILLVVVMASCFIYPKVAYDMQYMSVKTNFCFTGTSEQASVSDYYASDSKFYGGATLKINEEVVLSEVKVVLDNGQTKTHPFQKIDALTYVLDVNREQINAKPTSLELHTADGLYDTIAMQATLTPMYHFHDGTQSYRHVFINDAGAFLGNFSLKEVPENAKQMVTFEFCHKDDTKTKGYHVFAKKDILLAQMIGEKDLGFTPFLNGAHFDVNEDVYVIISYNETTSVELPLVKGVN